MAIHDHLRSLGTSGTYGSSDSDAWEAAECPHCSASQMVRVMREINTGGVTDASHTRWLRCPSCMKGAVIEGGVLSPSPKPLRVPKGLPPLDATIWNEARICLGAGAYAAAVMLCRKLLFHMAVAHGLPAKNDKDRAPTYAEAVTHLQSEGVITPKMKDWVDRVKDVGNDANHELAPITEEQASDVATFTLQLLILAYEMTALMSASDASEEPESMPI